MFQDASGIRVCSAKAKHQYAGQAFVEEGCRCIAALGSNKIGGQKGGTVTMKW